MLLERADALDSIQAVLARVRASGDGAVVSVAGEAGIGKTSLLREFVRSVPDSVWWGACDPLRNPRPLGALTDIALRAGGAFGRSVRATAPRPELFAASAQALGDRSEPVVVVVEDAHWADEATLDWLIFLGRRLAGVRALLIISHRDDDASGAALRATLGALGVRADHRIRLTPLSLAAVRAMIGPRPIDAAALRRVTGGNPFFVTECLGSMAAAAPPGGAPRPEDVPPSVADAVLARFEQLPAAARRCLVACSVHPGPLPLALVEALAGDDAASIDTCVAHGLLIDAATGLAFRHELARLAVLDTVPPVRRRALHRRALAFLTAGLPIEHAWAAFHAEHADDPDLILRYAPIAAAKARALGATRVARGHLSAAIAHVDRLGPAAQAELNDDYAAACAATGMLAESIAAYGRSIDRWQQVGDRRREAQARTERAGPLAQSGRQPEAVASVRAALALLEPLGPSPELASAYGRLCTMHMLAREFAAAADAAARSQDMATALGRRDHLSAVLIDGGAARLMSGEDGGLDDVRRGIELARELAQPGLVLRGLMQLGSGAGEIRRYDLARPALRDAVGWGSEHELAVDYPQAWLARCEFELGNWAEGGRLAEAVLGDPATSEIARFVAACVVGRLRARRGEPQVWAPLDDARTIALRTGHLQRLWPVAAARAEAAWLDGRLSDEVPLLETAYALAQSLDYPWALGELAWWLWQAGPLAAVPAGGHPAFGLLATGPAEVAAVAWAALGCPYEAALAWSRSEQPSEIRSAFTALDRLGAEAVLPLVAARLRARGAAVPPRASAAARAHPDGLTHRQSDVADLVARGLTNKEIAAQLYLSEKTVEHHVSAILSKLGLASRRSLRGR